jgi:transcriptional regulator with XRE-family HTH domain
MRFSLSSATLTAWAIVREARARAGLSQRQLAARAGKAQSEIARIENGRQDPGFGTLERLVRAAGFDLRIHLTPHDDHDDVLIDQMLAMSPEERLASVEAAVEFFAEARIV